MGETLGKYEIEKRQAISMEDYDKARRKKAQMEDFRLKMYEHLELPKLLESTGVRLLLHDIQMLLTISLRYDNHFIYHVCYSRTQKKNILKILVTVRMCKIFL